MTFIESRQDLDRLIERLSDDRTLSEKLGRTRLVEVADTEWDRKARRMVNRPRLYVRPDLFEAVRRWKVDTWTEIPDVAHGYTETVRKAGFPGYVLDEIWEALGDNVLDHGFGVAYNAITIVSVEYVARTKQNVGHTILATPHNLMRITNGAGVSYRIEG